MDMSRILIAKTGKTASEWLPLAVHLEDTAGIMQCMIRDMIPPSFPESCALSPEAFEKTAVFFAYLHDIGKAEIFRRCGAVWSIFSCNFLKAMKRIKST